uniref:Uncharacterized protein n=1 Tax=Tetradesmus obliquus TaxID=3088 RepID=A0A383WKA8_TETOB|eukprot:jgi/Sobl393_1/12019/SZX77683.1
MASSGAGDPGGSPPGAAVVRLSPLLRAYGASGDDTDYESAYWKSSEVSMFLVRADMLGLSMVLFNQLLMRIQQTRRSVALAGSVQVALALLTLLALLQLLLLHKRLKAYMRLRHSITMVNRLLRTLMALLPVAEQRYDIMSRWMQQSRPVPHPVAIVLAGYALFSPLLQLQISCIFSLPTAANLLQLPFATAQSLSWVWNAPLAMHKVRGMQQLATSVCNGFRGTLELILYVIVDLGAMPGVPAAGVDAFGLPDRCETGAVYAQLLVYAALMVTFFLPLYASYVIELRHKLSFWRRRDVEVVADRSVLLPLPGHLLLSHVLVCCAASLLLWVAAEQVAILLPSVA